MVDTLHAAILHSTANGDVDGALRLVVQHLDANPNDGLLRRVVARAALLGGRDDDAAALAGLAFAAELATGGLLGAVAAATVVREAGGDAGALWASLSQALGKNGFARLPRPAAAPRAAASERDVSALSGEPLLAAASALAARPVSLPPVAFGAVAWLSLLSNDALRWVLPRLRFCIGGAGIAPDAVGWIASTSAAGAVGTCILAGAHTLPDDVEVAWLSAADAEALLAMPGARAARDTAEAAARVATAIANSAVLADLPATTKRGLLSSAWRSTVEPGIVADLDRPFCGLAVVISGRLTLLRRDEDVATVVANLVSGDLFGEWIFAGDDPARWEVVAREPSELVWVDHARAHAALAAHADVIDALSALAARRAVAG